MTPNKRQKALQLEERMQKFSTIYNAAWMVRHNMHGHNQDERMKAILRMWLVIFDEARKHEDPEALLYAICDAVTCNPLGLPWEG